MEPEIKNETTTDAIYTETSDSFPQVCAVVGEWMLDFMFVSLCRRFKEGELDEFNETLNTFEAISQTPFLKDKLLNEKIMIGAFLARVMHGKQMDVQFEEDTDIMPLMSAARVWSDLKDTAADPILSKNISILLLVQSVAVCLEKGEKSSASSALKWFENNNDFPQNLGVKLSTIVAGMETYHPYLMSFSFNHLLVTVQSYLDSYLKKNPSDYLLKAATKLVRSSKTDMEDLEDVVIRVGSLSDTVKESAQDINRKKEKIPCVRTKRKLLSTKINDVWKPDSCKKPFVSVRRISLSEISQMTSKRSRSSPQTGTEHKKRRPKQKWTTRLDKYLKDGVTRHGVGKWSLILLDNDFEGRTGVMLKDRWRVLRRKYHVS